jgi:hypothetical protein
MGESGSRRADDMPAPGSSRSKAALFMFLAATFGVAALLSVPVARLLPGPLRVPRVIQDALGPLGPILPPFLRDASRPRGDQGARPQVMTPSGTVAGSNLVALSASSASSVGGAPPLARSSSPPVKGPAHREQGRGPSTPGSGRVGDRHGAVLASGNPHHGGKKDHGGEAKGKAKDDKGKDGKGKDDGEKTKKPKSDKK